jgi:hypothetical protein
MICNICGERNLTSIVYRSGSCLAPAMECVNCKALNLTEDAADTDAERESVKRVIAIRSEIAGGLPSTLPPPRHGGAFLAGS